MAKIAIIGSGFVGQATGKGFASRGHEVVFCDLSERVLKSLDREGYKVSFPDRLENRCDFDVFFISVPTPSRKSKADMSFIVKASMVLAQGALRKNGKYCLVVPRSTMLPGTAENMILPLLEEHSGKQAGKDFGVCVNPEILREKTSQDDFNNPLMIMIGELDEKSGQTLRGLYAPHFSCPIFRRSLFEAELFKLVHNAINAITISMGNEMGMFCKSLGVDPMEILPLLAISAESRWNPQYGFRRMGHFGGSCLPKDTVALKSWADEAGFSLPILKAAIEVNKNMIKSNGGFKKLPEKEQVY